MVLEIFHNTSEKKLYRKDNFMKKIVFFFCAIIFALSFVLILIIFSIHTYHDVQTTVHTYNATIETKIDNYENLIDDKELEKTEVEQLIVLQNNIMKDMTSDMKEEVRKNKEVRGQFKKIQETYADIIKDGKILVDNNSKLRGIILRLQEALEKEKAKNSDLERENKSLKEQLNQMK